ncbi:MAG TPA: S9 family peptidase [Steroidobacteraceae bacterium]|nr:S9 family peptidase [Steroidobacteraceae bacterium]
MRHIGWVLAALCCSLAAQAQQTSASRQFTAERMWALKRLGDPAPTPDGKSVVVPVTTYDIAENKGLTDLWLLPVAGGDARRLTTDKGSDTQATASPDGKWIAFVSRRDDDEETQLYVIPTDGGEARRVTSLPTGASLPKWFPDSRHLMFVSEVWPDLVRWEDQAARKKERESSKMTAHVWTRAPIAYFDHLLDDRQPHLFSIAIDGGEPTAVTRLSGFWLSTADLDGSSFAISPDGLEVAFAANVDRSGIEPNYDVIVLPTCGCKPARNISAANKADDFAPLYSPDGRHLAYLQQRIFGFYGDRTRLMMYDRKSGSTKGLTENWDRSADRLVWEPGSRSLLGAIDDAGTIRVYRFALDGGAPQPVTKDASFGSLAWSRNGKSLVAIRQTFIEPPTVVRLDPRSGAATAISDFNDAALAALDFGKYESVTYRGAKGDDIQMWVFYPPGFDATKQYPALMLLHGGPHNAIVDAVQWRWNAQVFASWGYVVTWHNFHGSSGFGNEFADSINPDRITLPYEDTIKAAEWLMARPFVDKERMVAAGASYGGFLAATLLGRPHPFKALVAHAAVYNSFTQIGADYGAEKERFFDYWDRPEEFARYSPHTYAGNFKTPTLVIHNQQDMRVPVNHGIELFNTLQKRGVPSKLVYFPDENHWVLKPQNSLFWYQTVRDWVATYAPPGAS